MSFDDLISILLIVLFLVVPLVRGAMRRGRGGPSSPPAGPDGERSGDGTAPRPRGAEAAGEASASTRTSPASGSASDASGDAPASGRPTSFDDEIQRMLERARRRVAEADGSARGRTEASTGSGPERSSTSAPQGSSPSSGSTSSGPPPRGSSAPFGGGATGRPRARSLVDGDDLASPSLGREGGAGFRSAQATADQLRKEERAKRKKRASSGPAVVTRRPGRSGPAARLPHAVELDRASIVDGFIWHQVLSKPAAKRHRSGPTRRPYPTRD